MFPIQNNNFNIVLVEPEIPQNTGNIIRTCACTGANLYLAGRLGFALTDKYMKRSGLDYHEYANVRKYDNLDILKSEFPNSDFYYFTTKSRNIYTEQKFKPGDFFVFGPETRGLDEELLNRNNSHALTIPMIEGMRSLNLSNSVAVVIYEAIRQCKSI